MQPAESSPSKQTWTILEVLRWTIGRFERQGIANARLDAELLATKALARSRIELYTHFDQPLGEAELGQLRQLVQRRLAGEPVAYILGRKEFWSLDLDVGAAVLIPRPDTETLVEEALELLGPAGTTPKRVADVGTGTGAIALALKKERPADTVVGVDVSPEALAVASGNAKRLGLDVQLLEGDLTAPLVPLAPFDLVVSNPPYVATADIAELAAEVRCEPRLALDGGADGLVVVRRLLGSVAQVLADGGAVAVEIGQGQAEATRQCLLDAGFSDVGSRRDLAGIERVVHGRLAARRLP